MSSLTTLELLSPPADVARQAQSEVAAAFHQGVDGGNAPPPGAIPFGISPLDAGVALSTGLADPEVTKKAYEDIRALADTIRNSRSAIQQITAALQSLGGWSFPEFVWMGFFGVAALVRKWEDLVAVRRPSLPESSLVLI